MVGVNVKGRVLSMCRIGAAALASYCGLASVGHAEVTYHFDAHVGFMTIYDGAGTEFVEGDTFHVEFTIDDSVTDHNPDEGVGNFGTALVDFTIERDPDNVGTWDPAASGRWSLPGEFFVVESWSLARLSIIADEDFPPVFVHGVPLTRPRPSFEIQVPINDTGEGQTWAEQVGPATGAWIGLYFDNDPTNSFVACGSSGFGAGPHPAFNKPPVADAGGDQTTHCESADGALVTLDGSLSEDPDGDELEYEWSVAEGSGVALSDADQAVATGLFPVGVHQVTLTVYDARNGIRRGGSAVASLTVTVVDDAPPVAMVTTDLAALFPANNDLVPVVVAVTASDACTAPDDLLIACTVSSSQPDDTTGSGGFTGDVDGADGFSSPVGIQLENVGNGTYAGLIYLRAERDGSDPAGRVYSINLHVMDASLNVGQASTTVVVPHNRGRR